MHWLPYMVQNLFNATTVFYATLLTPRPVRTTTSANQPNQISRDLVLLASGTWVLVSSPAEWRALVAFLVPRRGSNGGWVHVPPVSLPWIRHCFWRDSFGFRSKSLDFMVARLNCLEQASRYVGRFHFHFHINRFFLFKVLQEKPTNFGTKAADVFANFLVGKL